MSKKMLSPQDRTSVKDRLPAKSGCYYAILKLKNPEKYNKKLFKGIHEPRWYHKDYSGRLIDVTGIITHWIAA